MPPKRKCTSGKGCGGKRTKANADEDNLFSDPVAAVGATRGKGQSRGRGRGRGSQPVKVTDEVKSEPDAPPTTKQLIDTLKKSNEKKRTPKVDQYCTLSGSTMVLEDYDCMLNQTNIGNNNNKYYVIQVIDKSGSYYTWNRWGRVGEAGANALKGPMGKEAAIKGFEKKFYDKTKNKWSERENFHAYEGSYTLLEMGDDDNDDVDDSGDNTEKLSVSVQSFKAVETLPCSFNKPTQELIKLIFDNDMFQEAMKNLEIDVKKMPLGKISKSQIAKGFEALEKITDALNNNQHYLLDNLSSKFYTVIPHDFGRQRPPIIRDHEMLQKKLDLLTVLGDIEVAQAIQKEEKQSDSKAGAEKRPHVLDYKYGLLHCDLKHLDKTTKLYKTLEAYLEATKSGCLKILDIWEVNRHSEGERFAANDKIENRKLLWHGTNVAVVVAILKDGLRIMPHSGGRVGRGIYFASENGKSASYVRTAGNRVGIMFLNEVALGKEYSITCDNSSLVCAPKGYDSIVARGRTEPDPTKDTEITIDNHKVTVPQGNPIVQTQFNTSSFSQSEYLIYREDQCRIRFILKIQF